MKLTFWGAAGEVTGSCSLLETEHLKILVDCGMFQGGDFNEKRNHDPLPFNAAELTHVFVTHAHLDHVGRLPLLIKGGYSGNIYTNPATAQLAQLVLEDALEVMMYNHKKLGTPILYEASDIALVVDRFTPVDYYVHQLLKGPYEEFYVTFHDAGHIFGLCLGLFLLCSCVSFLKNAPLNVIR
jgi:metallo-beta-lactamase family protein